ncbi:MAG: hemerythrin family protein [Hungatella sp.]|nr:hemerythrin family protein [Hungatella sp.]
MENIVWNEQYNIGVEVVDNAHAKLFRIVNKLTKLLKDEQTARHACEEGIKYLENYTMRHFSEEEAYMRSIHYQNYAWHKKIHDNFRDKTLVSLRRDLQLSQYSQTAVERFLAVMTGWLTGHIITEDLAIVGKNLSKKIYEPSSKLSIVAKAVNNAMVDVFQVEAKLVQTSYKGQNIGNSLYCRLTYDIDNDGKVQLLLGVEEQLVLKGVGRLMKYPPTKRDTFVNTVALQIFEQLFRHMGKLFRSGSNCEITSNDLLDKDAFRADFMQGYPCSLLFNTRVGYFIFCFRTWKERCCSHHDESPS